MDSEEQGNRTGLSEAPMGPVGNEEGDFESDSEGTTALALRRQEASDEGEDDQDLMNTSERRPSFSDEDAEEGAPPVEEEEDDDSGEEEEEEEEEEDEDDGDESEHADDGRREIPLEYEDDQGAAFHDTGDLDSTQGKTNTNTSNKDGASDEKKDAEPFVVPTAGAFYMHDDRFRYNNEARPSRRIAGGRRLWEAKDEKPWVHDRFEELNLQEEMYRGQGSRGRGRFRGQERGKGRGKDAGYVKGRDSTERVFGDSGNVLYRRGSGRGRGLRRAKMDEYDDEKARRRSLASFSLERQGNNATSTQKPGSSQSSNKPQESKKPAAGSSLSSASPPFYPTGALSQSMTGALAGSSNSTQMANDKLAGRNAQQVTRVESAAKSMKEKGTAGLSSSTVTRQSHTSVNITTPRQSSAPSNLNSETESGLHKSVMAGPTSLQHQLPRTGSGSILQQQRLPKSEGLLTEQRFTSAPALQTGRVISLAQSMQMEQQPQQLQLPKQGQISQQRQPMQSQAAGFAVSSTSKSVVDVKAVPLSIGTNKIASSGSGRGSQAPTLQSGMGSLVYATGTTGGLTNGLCSVVQLTGQGQGGLGVPAVGVALPGYSSQPQFNFGNSEVTWIPILAGGGSLGSNLNSPYIAVDSGAPAVYYTQQTSQNAALTSISGRELTNAKPASTGSFKPSGNQDPGSDELGQRQNKPRRYSEMNFGQ